MSWFSDPSNTSVRHLNLTWSLGGKISLCLTSGSRLLSTQFHNMTCLCQHELEGSDRYFNHITEFMQQFLQSAEFSVPSGSIKTPEWRGRGNESRPIGMSEETLSVLAAPRQEKAKSQAAILLINFGFSKYSFQVQDRVHPILTVVNCIWMFLLTAMCTVLLGLSDRIQELLIPDAMGLTNIQPSCSLLLEQKWAQAYSLSLIVWWMISCLNHSWLYSSFCISLN